MSKLLKTAIKLSFLYIFDSALAIRHPRPLGLEYASFGARLFLLAPFCGGSIFRDYPKERASLITVWFEVRVLPGPPRIPKRTECSGDSSNSPPIGGVLCLPSVSAETNSANEGISGELSLASESGCPATETVSGRDAVRMW